MPLSFDLSFLTLRGEMIKPTMLKRVAFVFIAILLLSFVAVALHDHVDGDSHDNCPICVASHLSFAAPPNNSPEIYSSTVKLSFSLEGSIVLQVMSASIGNRAPPI